MSTLVFATLSLLYLPTLAFMALLYYMMLAYGVAPETIVAAKMGLGAGFVTLGGWPVARVVWNSGMGGPARFVLPACMIVLLALTAYMKWFGGLDEQTFGERIGILNLAYFSGLLAGLATATMIFLAEGRQRRGEGE